MNQGKPGGLYRPNGFDDPKMRVAKLKANCGVLLRNRPPGHKAQIKDIDREITQIMQRVASDPLYHDDLLTTRVTVMLGWSVPKAEVQAMFNLSVNSDEFDDAVRANGGELVEIVSRQLQSWAYTLEQPVLDEDFFVIGAVTGHSQATRLCNLLHGHYNHEIRTDQMRVAREFYGYHFPDVLTVQDAENYIRTKSRVTSCG